MREEGQCVADLMGGCESWKRDINERSEMGDAS